jgi:NADH-quinone oxidoreductase subunit L
MLLGWLLVMTLLGNVNIDAFLAAVHAGKFEPHILTLLAVLFFAAAVGKSAQLPLTAWQPEAMVGPTPVSALLHSATMVAAGVYLVLRFFPLFASAPGALAIVLWTGAVTAIFAAVIATSQADLKRILAWSTISQLGEMMMALGLAAPAAALFHLSTHAVFKAGLFLAAGAIERATGVKNLQDMGGLTRLLPLLGISFGVDALALAAFPLLSGFWSEESILAAASHSGVFWAGYICLLVFLAGVYISRPAAGIFLNWPGASVPATQKTGKLVLTTTMVLAVGSVVAGFLLRHPIEYFSFIGGKAVVEPAWTWRLSAIAASLFGLAFGTWRVILVGPQPSFGAWPAPLARLLYRGSVIPAKAALAISSRMWTEQMLDVAARNAANFIDTAGSGVVNLEDGGFVAQTNRVSSAIASLGDRLRSFETGKIYTYTRTVFVWAIFVVCLVALVWR